MDTNHSYFYYKQEYYIFIALNINHENYPKMQKLINLLLFPIFILALSSCAKAPFYQSTYQSSPFSTDKINTDWDGSSITEQEVGMVHRITNDEHFVYLKMKIVDRQNQQRILMDGLTLWFDLEGKTKKNLGFIFPLKNDKIREQFELSPIETTDFKKREQLMDIRLDPKNINKRFSDGKENIKIVKMGEVVETLQNQQNIDGLSIMMYMDEFHILYYEAKIPLNRIFASDDISMLKSTSFSYGFEIGKIETMRNMRGSMQSRQMSGNSGMYGNSGMSGEQQSMYRMAGFYNSKTEFWVKKVKLSDKEN